MALYDLKLLAHANISRIYVASSIYAFAKFALIKLIHVNPDLEVSYPGISLFQMV